MQSGKVGNETQVVNSGLSRNKNAKKNISKWLNIQINIRNFYLLVQYHNNQ